MSFRRQPFQFSTTDPAERQRELEKRFGLPFNRNMFVDVANPLSTGAIPRDSSLSSSSPRLQHRVPIFVEGHDQPVQSSVDSTLVTPENKKPNVRVIPIEVEGAETRPSITRHRTLSGPPGIRKEQNGDCFPQMTATSPLKHSMADLSQPSMTKSSTLPRVHNIPIQVEGGRTVKSPKLEKVVKSPKVNGCTVIKPKVKSPEKDNKKKPDKVLTEAEKQKIAVENSLKKIENVLEELKSYEAGVKEFNGTTKDKQYRYLDEMLTRCMLKMDEIDTMGNEELRSSRKNAVKKIQACIDLLESSATSTGEEIKTSEVPETCKSSESNPSEVVDQNDVEMIESQNVEQEQSKGLVENCVSQNEVQKSDIEMAESQDAVSNGLQDKQISSEVTSTQENVTNACEDQDKPSESSSEVFEVEMTEIKQTETAKDLNSEVLEIDMADSNRVQNTSVDDSIPVKEEKVSGVENTELVSSAASQEDIEMKDIQNTLDDIKETVTEDKFECISSQTEKEIDSNVKTVCNNECEVERQLQDVKCNSNVDNVS